MLCHYHHHHHHHHQECIQYHLQYLGCSIVPQKWQGFAHVSPEWVMTWSVKNHSLWVQVSYPSSPPSPITKDMKCKFEKLMGYDSQWLPSIQMASRQKVEETSHQRLLQPLFPLLTLVLWHHSNFKSFPQLERKSWTTTDLKDWKCHYSQSHLN